MAVQMTGRTATGEAITLVARGERTSQRRRNAARFASYIERLALGVFNNAHDARIARQAANGVRCEIRAIVQMAASLRVKLDQSFSGNVHLDFGVGASLIIPQSVAPTLFVGASLLAIL